MALLCGSLAASAAAQAAPTPSQTLLFEGRVIEISADSRFIWMSSLNDTTPRRATLERSDSVLATAALLRSGDKVSGRYRPTAVPEIVEIERWPVRVARKIRLVAMALSFVFLLVAAKLLLRENVTWLLVGEDNRLSNSKTQMAIWFSTMISAYLGTVGLRMMQGGVVSIGGVHIPQNLLLLSGISALTFAGAKGIVASRLSGASVLMGGLKLRSSYGPRLRDLVTDDSGVRPDIADFQMLVLTVIAAMVYLVTIYVWLGRLPLGPAITLPDVDSTLLGTYGVGQAVYLAKKMAGDTGVTAGPPPISESRPPQPDLAHP